MVSVLNLEETKQKEKGAKYSHGFLTEKLDAEREERFHEKNNRNPVGLCHDCYGSDRMLWRR